MHHESNVVLHTPDELLLLRRGRQRLMWTLSCTEETWLSAIASHAWRSRPFFCAAAPDITRSLLLHASFPGWKDSDASDSDSDSSGGDGADRLRGGRVRRGALSVLAAAAAAVPRHVQVHCFCGLPLPIGAGPGCRVPVIDLRSPCCWTHGCRATRLVSTKCMLAH